MDDDDDAGGTYKLMTSFVPKDCGNHLSIFNRVVSDSPFHKSRNIVLSLHLSLSFGRSVLACEKCLGIEIHSE